MPTPAQIEEQIKHEREAIKCGIAKITKQTRKAEEREYASSTVYGVSSIAAAQELVAVKILETFKRMVIQGKSGVAYADISQYLIQFNDPEQCHVLANIALKRLFDLVFSHKRSDAKRYPNSVANTTVCIGHAVEQECQIRWYEQQHPDLLKKVQKFYWKPTTGTEQKSTITRLMFNREGIKWQPWPSTIRARLGGWLVDLIVEATGWFEKHHVWTSKRHSNPIIIPTEAYLKVQEKLMDEALMFSPLAWPMLTEPNNWTNETTGGYYLNEVMRSHTLVRNGDPTLLQPDIVLGFINKLQKVEYKINQDVFDVAKELEEKGHKLGKFLPLSAASLWEMPNRPNTEDKDVLFQWRKDKTDAENRKKAYMRSMHVRTSITMDLAKRFEGKDRFYLPWSFDYRGRAYPIPPFLTIQDTDFGKSMLLFKEPAFMTPEAEEWLAFQVATTYGLDKACMSDRLEWVTNNHELITHIAEDPIGNIHLWENTDEPWQFLASCIEYFNCCIACTHDSTSLPVATDATCSGLQILAGLARDKSTAALVNVVPSEKPQDAYKAVAEAMIPLLPEELKWLAPYIDRTVTKRSVMTIPYNAKEASSSGYIREALKKHPDKIRIDGKVAYELAKILRQAMGQVAPAPLKVMDWIALEMGNAIDRGQETVDWITPSGFSVRQKRNKYSTKRLDLKLLGGTKFNVIDAELGPNKRKHKSSGAPNLIHSLDASMLHLTFQNFNSPFSVIHDSILCRATDMSCLSTLVRETYMNMFAKKNFLEDFAKQIGAETPPPIIGDLEPSSVIESTYFFC